MLFVTSVSLKFMPALCFGFVILWLLATAIYVPHIPWEEGEFKCLQPITTNSRDPGNGLTCVAKQAVKKIKADGASTTHAQQNEMLLLPCGSSTDRTPGNTRSLSYKGSKASTYTFGRFFADTKILQSGAEIPLQEKPVYYWIANSTLLSIGPLTADVLQNGTLVLNPARPIDSGLYICVEFEECYVDETKGTGKSKCKLWIWPPHNVIVGEGNLLSHAGNSKLPTGSLHSLSTAPMSNKLDTPEQAIKNGSLLSAEILITSLSEPALWRSTSTARTSEILDTFEPAIKDELGTCLAVNRYKKFRKRKKTTPSIHAKAP
ncbi:uncharacterized protein LOC129586618 isoform X2 [Paramacrobiotus metropolitanus]|uniref:uncharacterized protein LOC129586618 isoform X2 n=1 Tax=Paramacrobiotus metropolitanus TaxID=2943436 RepID=UPI002445F987|nr:uncharacterized protein LOC129586618 isoform X2 [Paramacrobiotus metropolitanus]